jgi:hypothetical protein
MTVPHVCLYLDCSLQNMKLADVAFFTDYTPITTHNQVMLGVTAIVFSICKTSRCPSSGILNTRKHDVSETGCFCSGISSQRTSVASYS